MAVLQVLLGLGSALEEVCEKLVFRGLTSGTVVLLGIYLWQVNR